MQKIKNENSEANYGQTLSPSPCWASPPHLREPRSSEDRSPLEKVELERIQNQNLLLENLALESHLVWVDLITIEKIVHVEYDDHQHNYVDYDDQNDSNMRLDDQVLHESLLIPRGRAALLLFWSLSSSQKYFFLFCFFVRLLSCGCPKDFAIEACVGVFAPNSGCALLMSQRQQKLEDNEVFNTLFRNVSQYRVEYFVSQLVTVPFQFCPRYVGPILKPICELTMHSSPFPSTPQVPVRYIQNLKETSIPFLC